ncbi:tyrosine-protein phosphatase 10D-like isoform X1 [Palaemon carinicauda]|uniref:tyrosine-protein phosphatase 10D-like isoform X1 n=1 Tax=Palaemon carinicauda TaxID=392227 RepID=UPI0035B67BDE
MTKIILMDTNHLNMKTLLFNICVITSFIHEVFGADVVIQIPPERVRDQDGFYRLDYWPPQGEPPPNTTFTPAKVVEGIELTRALPGTKYDFQLYYSNDTISDYPNWTASITTVPPPPSNLTIHVRSGRSALVSWDPPRTGGYSAFNLKVIPISESENSITNFPITENQLPFALKKLMPGASYELQLYTVYETKESDAYISSNFTTRPNAPGRFLVWYRNETIMLVLWQPPYPAGIYSHYKVSIDPKDAQESVLTVNKASEPPGPAQAAFLGLVPGRAYNISVETVSQDQISIPETGQHRTIPLAPRNITFDPKSVTPYSFVAKWEAPVGKTEFNRYQLSLGVKKKVTPLIVDRDAPREATFDGLEPGKTYNLFIKTVSGAVASWPTTGKVTLRPLPVTDLQANESEETREVTLTWKDDEISTQDHYKILYQEVETFNGDSRTKVVTEKVDVIELYPGRNYSLSVSAISNGVESEPTIIYIATRPLPVTDLQANESEETREVTLTWKDDEISTQDHYKILYQEVETFNGDSRTKVVTEKVDVIELYPGRNYSLSVSAISNGVESEPTITYIATKPASPIIEELQPIPRGLNIPWKSDVTSRQEVPGTKATEGIERKLTAFGINSIS